jgi:hypothetical protein
MGLRPLQGHLMPKQQLDKTEKEIRDINLRVIEEIKQIEKMNDKKYLTKK